MKCNYKEKRTEIILRYLTYELSASEKEAFEEHYFGCDECFEELRQTHILKATIKTHGERFFTEKTTKRESSNDKSRSIFSDWRIYAAAALIAGGLIYIAYTFMNHSDEINYPRITMEDTLKTKKDSLIKSPADSNMHILPLRNLRKNEPLLAESFIPSPVLDNYIHQTYRSGKDMEWLSPSDSIMNQDSIHFNWKSEFHESFTLKVISNSEKLIFSSSINTGYVLIPSQLKLKTGLYYWKIETEMDLIRVGKFIIKKSH